MDSDPNMDRIGWYTRNSGTMRHLIGGKDANAWDLYDMSGNVSEWTWDWFSSYDRNESTDPVGPPTGSYRVTRGGSYGNYARSCRSANRSESRPGYRYTSLGFRLSRSLEP